MKRWLVALVVLFALPAHADDDVDILRMRFVERGDDLTVSTAINKLFDNAAYDALSTGFASTILISTAVYSRDGGDPVAVRLYQRSIVYDIWDEVYIIKLDTQKQPLKVKRLSEAFKLIYTIDSLPVAKLADIPVEDVFYLKMTVQLNPVSKQTLAEVRRWLSQGTGGGLDRGGVFFGSFVSVFVNPKIAEADRVLKLQSKPFYRQRP